MGHSTEIYKNIRSKQFAILKGDLERFKQNIKPYLKKQSLHLITNPEWDSYMLEVTIAFEKSGFKGEIFFIFRDIKGEDFYKILVVKSAINQGAESKAEVVVAENIRWGEIRDNYAHYISLCLEAYETLELK